MSERRRERKVVTVLFADLVGFTSRAETLDPEDVEAILGPYHERLRAELERHGGTVEKFIGDAVMAVFGAPVVHEDDAERAVRAALAIRDAIVDDGALEVRIGVNTGEALVNVDARPEAGQGMVSGDVVNTGARLQSAAPQNGVLVGESTFRATRHAIDYREHDPIDAKGKAEPVPVWEAVQARSRVDVEVQRPRAPLVGRDRELDALVAALERMRSETTTQLVTLVGAPGIGKSRLVYELYRVVESDPELVWWRHGRSLPYGEGISFWALGQIVKTHAGILETDPPDVAAAKLEAALVPMDDADRLRAHLRPLVGLGGDAPSSADARGEAFAAWRHFFENLAEQHPLVLVFEDLHWADDGLLDFVDHLVDWATGVPILVVASTRPELLERRPNWGGGKRNTATISLSPLAEEDTARLLSALVDRSVLPVEQQRALLQRAGGNPLYAEEFARMLAEHGDHEQLPETLQGVIDARLDILPREEKSLLHNAAVLGKVFWLGALESMNGATRRELEERLHMLARKEFVRRERRSSVEGDEEYTFMHVLVRDAAYSQIARADRAEKHARAAQWIEALGRTEDIAEMLAYHYLQALENARASRRDTAPEVMIRSGTASRRSTRSRRSGSAVPRPRRRWNGHMKSCRGEAMQRPLRRSPGCSRGPCGSAANRPVQWKSFGLRSRPSRTRRRRVPRQPSCSSWRGFARRPQSGTPSASRAPRSRRRALPERAISKHARSTRSALPVSTSVSATVPTTSSGASPSRKRSARSSTSRGGISTSRP